MGIFGVLNIEGIISIEHLSVFIQTNAYYYVIGTNLKTYER